MLPFYNHINKKDSYKYRSFSKLESRIADYSVKILKYSSF